MRSKGVIACLCLYLISDQISVADKDGRGIDCILDQIYAWRTVLGPQERVTVT